MTQTNLAENPLHSHDLRTQVLNMLTTELAPQQIARVSYYDINTALRDLTEWELPIGTAYDFGLVNAHWGVLQVPNTQLPFIAITLDTDGATAMNPAASTLAVLPSANRQINGTPYSISFSGLTNEFTPGGKRFVAAKYSAESGVLYDLNISLPEVHLPNPRPVDLSTQLPGYDVAQLIQQYMQIFTPIESMYGDPVQHAGILTSRMRQQLGESHSKLLKLTDVQRLIHPTKPFAISNTAYVASTGLEVTHEREREMVHVGQNRGPESWDVHVPASLINTRV